jgi:hypothetical protein
LRRTLQRNSRLACTAASDGVTNPAPINGNTRRSYSIDGDGDFRVRAKNYYKRGALKISGPRPRLAVRGNRSTFVTNAP